MPTAPAPIGGKRHEHAHHDAGGHRQDGAAPRADLQKPRVRERHDVTPADQRQGAQQQNDRQHAVDHVACGLLLQVHP